MKSRLSGSDKGGEIREVTVFYSQDKTFVSNDKEKKMARCKECSFYFPVPENAGDFEAGKGDCVTQKEDAKGKYWLSKPTTDNSPSCQTFKQSK